MEAAAWICEYTPITVEAHFYHRPHPTVSNHQGHDPYRTHSFLHYDPLSLVNFPRNSPKKVDNTPNPKKRRRGKKGNFHCSLRK